MSKASPVHTDPRVLRPIIEALIFASEEPLAPRLLVRLLAGERDEPRSKSTVSATVDSSGGETAAASAGGSKNVRMNGASAEAQETDTLVEETTFNEEALRIDSENEAGIANEDEVDESALELDAA